MKKAISVLVIAVLIVSVMSLTAFARGGYRGSSMIQEMPRPAYELCTQDDCDILGPHQHDGVWYCSQDGCGTNYGTCTVEGCTLTGLHEHNGIYYRCGETQRGLGCRAGQSYRGCQ